MSKNRQLLPSGLPRIESLEMRGIVKRFPGVLASDHVDFDVKAGEIHALLGENGAGKSTLMKILYGLYQPDEGEVFLNGRSITIHSPTDSTRHGIGMIHQHFMLVNNLTVAENVALGLPSSRAPRLDLDVVSARIRELADKYNLQVDPNAIINKLAVGQRQRVEIVKALYRGAALLVLDEPTAVLTPQEVDDIFVILRQMAADGHALIFISHKLDEIFALTDRVTVLRDGRVVGTHATQDVTKKDLANMMVGREVLLERVRPPRELGDVRLKLENVTAVNEDGQKILKNVSFEVRSGEIVGVAGISGNGQRPLARSIVGLHVVNNGRILLDDQDVTHLSPAQMYAAGLSYIPEERMHNGVVKDFSVAENMILQDHINRPFSKGIFLDFKYIAQHAGRLIKNFRVKTPTQETPTKNLSGGNIQKLILARELARKPQLLIAAQPTRGVDIGATEYIHNQLLKQRSEGLATLLISEDLDEVKALSDRIVVLYGGEIMGIVNSDDVTTGELGLMMAGERIA
ncbi:ABC transporter, ATP-binding protein (cluster 11, riboflavin/purine nucleoside/unknown) / ABC transporter, ATP-binding protein (cluster 11, riboflavin/purine nucleoside/unknown) [hydrothermal vent metagenome]|uniref:ABC transporter domain-containing protein n=1 Tax=hydrothermal vent metagenome TaxID=652676 RepID=A0A3B0UIV6_9ZZZZ